ncbi:MAG TPA: UvrD-helicase domain-containing protein [Gemmatimonadaceae bacterium]
MPDAEHRAMEHRTRAVDWLTHDLAVTAGAGAGKTTVLVDRFVKIARDPALGPDRILAITFTRKAAVEMKERAVRIFERAGEVQLRRSTEAAYISTIHGFAERVLRERPFDARIDPAFSVLTPYEQALFFQDALQRMYARDDLRALALRLKKEFRGGWRVFTLVSEVASLLREGPDAARREADALAAGEDACVELAMERARAYLDARERDALAALRALDSVLEGATFKSYKGSYESSRAYLAAARDCVARGSITDALGVLQETRFTGQIVAEEREAIKALLKPIKETAQLIERADWAAEEALERELLPVRRAIYSAADDIARAYAEHKRRIGALDFHDLQARVAQLFADVDVVRAELAERFRHILLDEAQDTDELQYRIIQSLRTSDNTLFIVGDPKQAIYEFRGANPEVFHTAVRQLRAEHRLELRENFRSRPEIVSFVNGIGPALLGEHFAPIDARADYGGEWLEVPAITALYAIQHELPSEGRRKRYEPLSDVRPREADAVAEEIVRLLHERPRVRDPESRDVQWVPLRPKHIALLFRTRTAIPYFEHALAERGVPYVTAAGQGFYDRAEVLDCLMMLRVLAQPLDDLAMAAVLRSPFVGATDADLWRLHRARATRQGSDREGRSAPRALYHALRDCEPSTTSEHEPSGDVEHTPLAEFRRRFRALRRRTRSVPAWRALEDALHTFGYEAALAGHEDGPAMLANLRKLRRQLHDLGAISAGEAYAELERTRELMTEEPLAPLVGPADDVVVLTTIHQAKGLEWPVVCLPNLQAKPPGSAPDFSARHGVLLCDALDGDGEPKKPLSLCGVIEELRARAEAEERRLLYVALTRARERLILSASVQPVVLDAADASDGAASDAPEASATSERYVAPLAFLLRHTERTLAVDGEHDCASYRTRVCRIDGPVDACNMYRSGETLAATFEPAPVSASSPASASFTAASAESRPAVLPLAVKVTELLAFRRCPQVYRFTHDLEIDEHLPRRAAVRGAEVRGLSAVELGTIVHALLERARFDAPDLNAEVARLLETQPVERHAALRRMLEPVLTGELGAAVRAARRVEREWPFATDVGGVLLDGVIDLAIQTHDGRWTVVDYKSNDLSRAGQLDYLIDRYTSQLELYALALSRAGVGDVAECALVFLAGPVVHRWRFDVATTNVDVWPRETIARIAARDYATSAGPKCERCGYRKRKICAIGREWAGEEGIGASERVHVTE